MTRHKNMLLSSGPWDKELRINLKKRIQNIKVCKLNTITNAVHND